MSIQLNDQVIVFDGDLEHSCIVTGEKSWEWISLSSESGKLFLKVVFNKSAFSWSRIVELDPVLDGADDELMDRIAESIAWDPDRKAVDDIPMALRLLPKAASIKH